MIQGTPRDANSLSPVPSAARPSRTARLMLFSFMDRTRLPSLFMRCGRADVPVPAIGRGTVAPRMTGTLAGHDGGRNDTSPRILKAPAA